MRELVDVSRIGEFMRALGRRARAESTVYFTGGATAVLMGWRASTVDLDIEIIPDSDAVLKEIPALKESLHVNVELASPGHFIPPLPGWQERSAFISREGFVTFRHYDLYAQALAKIERGHRQDLSDVDEMLGRGLIKREELLGHYRRIEPELFRYPAIDPKTFQAAVELVASRAR